jgi:hypothetical protein
MLYKILFRVITSRRMGWVGHVARGRDEKCIQNFNQKSHLEDLGIDGKILECVLRK